MFDQLLDDEAPAESAPLDEAAFDEGVAGPVPLSRCAPSGWLALELDQSTAEAGRLSDHDLIEGIVGLERVASWAQARQARLLAEFAARRPSDAGDAEARRCARASVCSPYAVDEVGLALRLSRTTASARLQQAASLVEELPATLAAFERGAIDAWKARAITETSWLLPDGQRAALESRVLGRASEQTLGQLRAALARGVLALDPHGAQTRHTQARMDRRVVVGPECDGMASLWALLSAPDATAAYQRLCRLARDLGAADPRGMDARRADLLAELLTGRRCAATGSCVDDGECAGDCSTSDTPPADRDRADAGADDGPGAARASDAAATGPADRADRADRAGPVDRGVSGRSGGHCHAGPAAGSGKPLVHVIVPVTMLMGLDEQPGELVGYGPIPAGLAREIAADGTWRRLLTDPASGALLDHGRTTYTPPAALADFVRARDVYCRAPICRQLAATADLDHAVAFDDGGSTSDRNLYSGCRHHHRTKTHAPGWHVEQHPDGRVTWMTPTGHTYTSHPHDYRPNPPGPEPPPPPPHPPEPGGEPDPPF